MILVPGFYTHFSLEKNSAEYDTDVALEFESSETRQHFREFYKDVVPELESFGRIKTLKYCCNTEIHLRGNLYVEYYTEREAARALRKLKGRWYAGRQLNCEFANLKSWRSAVCGMTKCPKGRACNFLHTFKNPHDEYDIKSPPRWAKQSASSFQEVTSSRKSEQRYVHGCESFKTFVISSSISRSKSKWEDVSDAEGGKNWRWSESPEPEVEHRARNTESRHRRSDERDYRQKSVRDRRHDQSDKDKFIDNVETSSKRCRSRSRKHFEDKAKDENVSNGRESSRRHSRKHQRRREEGDDIDEPKSPRHSRKTYSKSSGRSSHSKSRRYSNKYSRKEKEDRTKIRHKSKGHNEFSEDITRRKSKKNSGRLSAEETDNVRHATREKSKWDKENSEEISSESSESTDSDSSGTVEAEKTDKSAAPRKACTEKSDDEWATTDSESEPKVKEKQ